VKRFLWTMGALIIILAASQPLSAEERFDFFASLGTGPTNGVYYPVGGAICTIVNEDLRSSGVRCSSETTPGSVYNIDALQSGELEFALVQSDVAFAAYNGEGVFAGAPFRDLRSVLLLHSELVTIVARPEIHQLSDLSGKRINVGPEGSGSRSTWDNIQTALGWTPAQTPRIVDMSIDQIGAALCSGSIDAALLVLGHPSPRIRAMLDACALNLLAVGRFRRRWAGRRETLFYEGENPGRSIWLERGCSQLWRHRNSHDDGEHGLTRRRRIRQVSDQPDRRPEEKAPGARKPEQSSDPAGQTSGSPPSRRGPGQRGAWDEIASRSARYFLTSGQVESASDPKASSPDIVLTSL
jgi:TRAP transporter TAXI family solute receptor